MAALPFVETVHVNFPKGVATVTMKASAPATQEALRFICKAVEQVGYEVERLIGLDESGSRGNTPIATVAGLEGGGTPSKAKKHKDSSSSSNSSNSRSTTQLSLNTEMELSVGGMTCQSCVRTLTRTLEGVRGVEPGSIRVNLTSGIVQLRLCSQGGRDDEREERRDAQPLGQLVKAVESVGFEWRGCHMPPHMGVNLLSEAGSGRKKEEEDKKEDDDDDSTSSKRGFLQRIRKEGIEKTSSAAVKEEEGQDGLDEEEDELSLIHI